MAFSAPLEDIEKMRPPEGEVHTLTADVAVEAGQVVKLTGNQTASPSDTDGENAFAVATQSVASGDTFTALGTGAKVLFTAGDAIGAGEPLASHGGTGDEGTVAVADATGDNIIGYATESATSGDVLVGTVNRGGEVN